MINQNLLLTGDDGYNLTNSLRFRSSASAYLNRTPASAGNRQTWTLSFWLKTSKSNFDYYIAEASTNSSTDRTPITFNSGKLQIRHIDGSATQFTIETTQVFRDPSSWYHFVIAVDTTQVTSTNRVKIYVNGSQITAFGTASYPTQNLNTDWNGANAHSIGSSTTPDSYADMYLTEFYNIDGQALTPSSFGETSTTTGVWIPKKYTGTYGTNGFYLPFTNTTSTSTLGNDFSGNSNTWTVNNISLTSGSTYDSMTDVPTNTSATAANYAVLNPLAKDSDVTISNGNLNFDCTSAGLGGVIGTIAVSSGKWYWEVVTTSGIGGAAVGIAKLPLTAYDANQTGTYLYLNGGDKRLSPSTDSAYGASYTTNDVIGVALDMDAGTVTFYKNNTSQGTAFSSLSGDFTAWVQDGSNGQATVLNINFGQRPFAYTPPTGFVALNTFNLPTPTIGATAATTANKYFNAVTYTGTSGTQAVTGVGFQPDFVWIKNRTSTLSHVLQDAVRGTTAYLVSNATTAENTNTANNWFRSFDSDGFTVATLTSPGSVSTNEWNNTGYNYVSWNWRASNATAVTNTNGSITSSVSANTTAGFSIVTYTGTGANATVGHGLGVAPSMVIIKSRTNIISSGFWIVYHRSLGNTKALWLQSTAAEDTNSVYWNNTTPTSSVFTVGAGTSVNSSSDTYVAYCFAPIAGYSAFGSYTGNGSSTDGPFVYLGFRPRFVMIKRYDSPSTNNWSITDTSINPYNNTTGALRPNTSDSESTVGTVYVQPLSNGFKITNNNTDTNASSGTYIYACFAENPFKYSNAR